MSRLALLLLVGCSRSPPPVTPPPPPTTTPPPTASAAPAPDEAEAPDEACARYHALFAKLDACRQLSEEDRQRLVQQDTDMLASQSESGMDGDSPYDAEAGCEDGVAFLVRVAAAPCGWQVD